MYKVLRKLENQAWKRAQNDGGSREHRNEMRLPEGVAWWGHLTLLEGTRLTAGRRHCSPSLSLFITCSRSDQTQAGPSDGLSLHHTGTASCLQGRSRPKREVGVGQARGSQSKTGRPDCVCRLREENQREEEGLKIQKEGRCLEEQRKVVCPGGGAGQAQEQSGLCGRM